MDRNRQKRTATEKDQKKWTVQVEEYHKTQKKLKTENIIEAIWGKNMFSSQSI